MPWRGQWIEAVLHTDRDLLIGDVTLGEVFSAGGANPASSPPQTASPEIPQHGQDHDHDDDDFENAHGAQSTASRMPAVEQVGRQARAPIRPRAPEGEPWPSKTKVATPDAARTCSTGISPAPLALPRATGPRIPWPPSLPILSAAGLRSSSASSPSESALGSSWKRVPSDV
jgi:hypothetical protein